ncbi:MAG: hypothetical protein ACRYF0_07630 [Janthinobacterium lividum]
MTEQIPHPFRPGEHVTGALLTQDDRSLLAAGIAEHVTGQRITQVEFTRSLDAETSKQLGVPVDQVDLTIYLANNVAYCARLMVHSLATISRGGALAHIPVGAENYVVPTTTA